MKKALSIILLLCTFTCRTAAQIPQAPNPPRLVNDFAGLFSADQQRELETRLVAFNDSTSNVICVVCVPDLGDYTAQEFAYEIGDKWGVKDKKYNNGVVILVKPKNASDGEVAIQVGYDLEGVITDATAKKIIENEMIPHFMENDYYGGVFAAVEVICPLAAGEISEKELYASNNEGGGVIAFILLIIVLIFAITLIKMGKEKGGGNNGNGGGNNDAARAAFWAALLSSTSDKQRHSGNGFGNFGGGGFGGGSFGGGGFGGFGGSGGFGGGGASGKW